VKVILFLIFIFSHIIAFEYSLSSSITSNARTVYIEFIKDSSISFDKVIVDKKEYKIFEHPRDKTKMYALIPTSYYQKPTTKKLQVLYEKNRLKKIQTLFLKVEDAKYAKEKIVVQKSKVNPTSKKVKQRTAKEYAEAMKIYNRVTPKSYLTSKFIVPMKSKITSDFGKARVYNNTLNGYHSGTDFRAKIGTPIIASNDGVVVLAKDRFYSGNSIIIDHGRGIYTCYYHLSKFKVKKGEMVKKSQTIGLSGDTGRITGPHLHFSARVGGLQVDPLQMISLLNRNLF